MTSITVLQNVAILCTLILVSEANLPDFFTDRCYRNDPDLGGCIQRRAKDIVPILVKGVEELNIPPLNRLKLPEFVSSPIRPFRLYFDGILEGVEGLQYTNSSYLNIRTPHPQARAIVYVPKVSLFGNYDLAGYVGGVPIRGRGPAEIIIDGAYFNMTWDFSKPIVDGSQLLVIDKSQLLSYEVEGVRYNFENLFEGDEVIGATMNDFLNANWKLLEDEFASQVALFTLKLILEVANKVLYSGTFDEIFYPAP